MRRVHLIPVRIGRGLVVMHTPAELARLRKGVDMEGDRQYHAPMELEDDEHEDDGE